MKRAPWQQAHDDAVRRGRETYADPETGYVVLTETAHRARGTCCRSVCRHCPWGYRGEEDASGETA